LLIIGELQVAGELTAFHRQEKVNVQGERNLPSYTESVSAAATVKKRGSIKRTYSLIDLPYYVLISKKIRGAARG